VGEAIEAETVVPPGDWRWLTHYLRPDEALTPILESFPKDPPMRAAMDACRGLRLLRQEPWECLASFLLSSTKQIPQIRQGIRLLCERYGEPIPGPEGREGVHAFPTAERLAGVPEAGLRDCRIGFRAKYLKAVAEAVAGGSIRLESIGGLPLEEARAKLEVLPGVGPKIADCVLLFAYGLPKAFPVDVWVMKALRELYFGGRAVSPGELRDFSRNHFGPNAGYAQQYLFHHIRQRAGRVSARRVERRKEDHGN